MGYPIIEDCSFEHYYNTITWRCGKMWDTRQSSNTSYCARSFFVYSYPRKQTALAGKDLSAQGKSPRNNPETPLLAIICDAQSKYPLKKRSKKNELMIRLNENKNKFSCLF